MIPREFRCLGWKLARWTSRSGGGSAAGADSGVGPGKSSLSSSPSSSLADPGIVEYPWKGFSGIPAHPKIPGSAVQTFLELGRAHGVPKSQH